MLKIGLTGGIASGKSTVTAMFAERGAAVIDADRAAREVVAPGTPGLAAVRDAFGESVIGPSGELDRTAMRESIFRDPGRRRRLEGILHPLIRARLVEELARSEGPYAVVAVPLLVETGFAELVDRVLTIDCPEPTQLDRLMKRDDMEYSQAIAMIAAQASRSARLDAADDVIDNSGDLETTARQVERLHRRYLEIADVCRASRGRAE